MSYKELSNTERVKTAIGFVAYGADIPTELKELLGEDLIFLIENPQKDV